MDIPPTKTPFIEVFRRSELDYDILANVAHDVANVPKMAVRDMINGSPVTFHNAERVLRILSQHTGKIHTLDTVDIPMIPTFAQLLETLNIIPSDLVKAADVSENIIQLMIDGRPVFQESALHVLNVLSAMTQYQQRYTLENVDVNILMFGVEVNGMKQQCEGLAQ